MLTQVQAPAQAQAQASVSAAAAALAPADDSQDWLDIGAGDRALVHGERTVQPVVAYAMDPADGFVIPTHAHRRGQMLYAISGVMLVRAASGSWVVPPGRAVWVPPRTQHEIVMAGDVAMRTVFVEPGLRAGLWESCQVFEVSPLLRELVIAAVGLPRDYVTGGRDEHLMTLVLDEIERAQPLSLHVPMPAHAGLAALCRALVRDPAQEVSLAGWARVLHMHPRSLARLFLRETGMNLGEWCRETKLLLSLPRLVAGASVLEVALEHGYNSPSAFTAAFRRSFGAAPSEYLRGKG
ncbi:helix-turn-helix domain-containing protein [Bordetella sp. LUAb4]|uniref:AraC family transcriptional regulator n=1 Tax=Bordetella sp. LUAb4 TaxID=2843195 RepID=UPI001E2D0106